MEDVKIENADAVERPATGGGARRSSKAKGARARSAVSAPMNGAGAAPRRRARRRAAGAGGGGGSGRRLGLWLIGAKGDVATTVSVGIEALRLGLTDTTGIVTECHELAGTDLVPVEGIVLGGYDVRGGSPLDAARNVDAESGLFGAALLDAVAPGLEAFGARIKSGFIQRSGPAVEEIATAAIRKKVARPSRWVSGVKRDLARFARENALDAVVVVNVASTEPTDEPPACYASADALLAAIAKDDAGIHASVLYATGAIEAGCPYVNFTPSFGSSIPALAELAERRGVPHMGRDGKTGETLVKAALAPLFVARNLQVLSWTGQNILGNRDGRILEDPTAKRSKSIGKDQVLKSVLGDRLGTSRVGIDFVPSLGDWKTAWDLIHFQGFLGTKMTLQFTWQGADSALAAPLVIDLARLAERAARSGRSGLLTDLAVFFKNPDGVEDHALVHQLDLLLAFAEELRSEGAAVLEAGD